MWFHALVQTACLGQFCHFLEDPIEKLHKEEKLLDRAHCHFRSHENREEAKAVRSALADVPAVRAQSIGSRKERRGNLTSHQQRRKLK
jgi:hypothetical protein